MKTATLNLTIKFFYIPPFFIAQGSLQVIIGNNLRKANIPQETAVVYILQKALAPHKLFVTPEEKTTRTGLM